MSYRNVARKILGEKKIFGGVLFALGLLISVIPNHISYAATIEANIASANLTITNSDTYHVTGTTTSKYITVSSGSPTIILDGVSMTNSGKSCITIASGATATIILKNSNTLSASGYYYPAINIQGGVLNMKGIGMLTATSQYGPGIGADANASNKSFGTINIYSGTINASASATFDAAGIGGGHGCKGGIINIYGGNITANGGVNGTPCAAGIGYGGGATASSTLSILIAGGTVTAKGGAITKAEDIGFGNVQTGLSNTQSITGGTVKGVNGKVYTASVNSTGNVSVDIPLSGLSITDINSVSVDGVDQKISDLHSSDTSLHVYMTKDVSHKVVVGGVSGTYNTNVGIYQVSGNVATLGNQFENGLKYNGVAIRTSGTEGFRFKNAISDDFKNQSLGSTGFEVVEYGTLVVTDANYIGELSETLTGKMIGISYQKATSTDKVFLKNETDTEFTGTIIGIPQGNYQTKIITRSYAKLSDGVNTYLVYGVLSSQKSIFDVAELIYQDINEILLVKEYVYNNILKIVNPNY